MAKAKRTIRIAQSKMSAFYLNSFNQFRIVGNVYGEVEKSYDDIGAVQGKFVLFVKGTKLPVIVKGKYAENLASQIKPNDLVGVFGFIKSREYQNEFYLELYAKEVEMLIKSKGQTLNFQEELESIENFYDPKKITERLEHVE